MVAIAFGVVLALALVLGVNTVSIFGNTCYFIGPIQNANSCIPPPIYFITWLCVAGLILGGGFSLLKTTPDTNSTVKKYDYDREKWESLVAHDAQIAAAAGKVQPLGEQWVNELAKSYLVLSDKQYLPSIVSKIIEKATDYEAIGFSRLNDKINEIFKVRSGYLVCTGGAVALISGRVISKSYSAVYEYIRETSDEGPWPQLTGKQREDFVRDNSIALKSLISPG